jgi:ParB family chromosome partitioning protein
LIKKKRGLGRGLNALLGSATANDIKNTPQTQLIAESSSEEKVKDGQLRNLPIELIQPGMYQPRIDMQADALEELADSIRAQGIIQPIVVRAIDKKTGTAVADEQYYEIIAGERRWRAAQMAGLDVIPAVIREVTDKATIAMALIENIQREDLNPIEEATSIKRLIDEFEMTHQKAAEAVGRSRTSVTNLLRLLELGNETRILLENGDLEMGHARALLVLDNNQQIEAAKQVISLELSVRDTEKLVKKIQNPILAKPEKKPDADILSLENSLSEKLGANVSFKHNDKGKGKLFISYNSLDELDGILSHIN